LALLCGSDRPHPRSLARDESIERRAELRRQGNGSRTRYWWTLGAIHCPQRSDEHGYCDRDRQEARIDDVAEYRLECLGADLKR
jgi:hypothetical protein